MSDQQIDETVEALELLPQDWKIEISAVFGGWFVRVSAPGPKKIIGRKVHDVSNVKFEGNLSSLDNLSSLLAKIY